MARTSGGARTPAREGLRYLINSCVDEYSQMDVFVQEKKAEAIASTVLDFCWWCCCLFVAFFGFFCQLATG